MPKFSVKKPLTVFVSVVLVIVLGVISFTSMSTDLLPEMELPYVAVMTTSAGSSPEKIEKNVTKPLEGQLATTSGIKEIQSISSENVSFVIMEFYDHTDMNSVMIEISSKIDLANLEEGIPNPTIMQMNPSMMPVLVGAIDMDDKDMVELSEVALDEVVPTIERIDGVASVTTTGLIEDTVSVALNQDKIDEINTNILKKIDSTLASTKSQLDSGKSQLSDAKKQLREQESKQSNQLVSGEIQINDAKQTIQLGISGLELSIKAVDKTIAELEAKIAQAGEYGVDAKAFKEALKEAKDSKKGLEGQLAELKGQLKTLNTQSDQLTKGQDLMAEKMAEAYQQIEEAQAQLLQGQIAFDTASEQAYQAAGLTSALTKASIGQILTAENLSMPAGYIDVDNVATLVKVGDEFKDIDEIKNLVLLDQEGFDKVTLGDIADVQIVNNLGEKYAKINGNDGLLFTVSKQSTASTAEVSNRISEQIEQLEKDNKGLHITSLNDQGVYIDLVVDSVINNLALGGLLAVVILFIFLKDIKTTIITAFSIPISLMFAVVLMYFSGVSLNIISLAGLALGVGMLVDNSIVVVENIFRLKSEGMDTKKAAVKGASQMAGAITASTLTTICVFLPIVFTEGITRQLFVDMGLTIAYSLIASLIIALTLVPAMSSMMLGKEKKQKESSLNGVIDKYVSLLEKVLSKKGILLGVVTVLFIGSCFAITKMGTAFIPDMDSEMISASVSADETLTDEEFVALVDKTMPLIENIEGVNTVGVMEGGNILSSLGGGSGHSMSVYILLDEKRSQTSQEIASLINKLNIDEDIDLMANGSTMDLSALMGSGIQVVVKGQDLDELLRISNDLKKQLGDVKGISEVTNGQEDNDKEIVLTVDKNKAMKHQLTVAQVYAEVAQLLQESVKSTSITYQDGTNYPIVIEDKNSSVSLDEIKKHEIAEGVKIGDLVTVSTQDSMKSIAHLQQSRAITVTATIDEDQNVGKVGKEVNKVIKKYETPNGYSVEVDGENEVINETLFELVKMIALAIVFIYMIMVAQFQSLKSPFIVLFTLPLAFTGGLIALILTGNDLSMIAMLGFLILSGVVVNNGIVFVDYINQLKEEGYSQKEAILLTGRRRIRPVVMTALTTILGLSTMALGLGSGADMLAPMAIVTIGGLIYATFMTLFVVPSIYDLINRKDR